ncbi:L-serine ammonia-lyase, partial [Pseudomonas syringae]|uniref:serine dehydratase beta chain n=1 Tax=Pseudomonas syringae TaxID=317 RepID=UPI001025BE34
MAISVFDMFKIGIGPSSSHTVGPMRAGALFVTELRDHNRLHSVERIEVRLYGSLSATGIGHGSDRATVMGLMGEWPDQIDPSQVNQRIDALRADNQLKLARELAITFVWERDMCLLYESLPYHPNGMTLCAYGKNGQLHEQTYYSVCGGFVTDAEQAASGVLDNDTTVLPYDFFSGAQLTKLWKTHCMSMSELMLGNDKGWRSEDERCARIMVVCAAMRACVDKVPGESAISTCGPNVRLSAKRLLVTSQ